MDGESSICEHRTDRDGRAYCRDVVPVRVGEHCARCQADPAYAAGMLRTCAEHSAATGDPCPYRVDLGQQAKGQDLVRCALVDRVLGWTLVFPAATCTGCTRRKRSAGVLSLVRGEALHRLALGDDAQYDLVRDVSIEQARTVLRDLDTPEARVVEAWKACIHRGAAVGERDCPTCKGHVRLKTFPCAAGHGVVTMQDCQRCGDAQSPPYLTPGDSPGVDARTTAPVAAPAPAPVAPPPPSGTILVLRHGGHRDAQDVVLTARIAEAGYRRADTPLTDAPDGGIAAWADKHGLPAATVRWEEHAGLWGESKHWHQVAAWCYEHGVVPLYADFAYFGHYGGLMFDRYLSDGGPSIGEGWLGLPTDLDLASTPGHLGQYVRMILDRYAAARDESPAVDGPYVAAYVQNHSPRSNVVPCTGGQQWVEQVYRLLGKRVAFKAAPVGDVAWPQGARVFAHDADHPRVNANLAVHAQWCLTNSSSITNEFLVAGLPVVVTGRSWHTSLGVFDEPRSWDELGTWTPRPIRTAARARYAAWWVAHQALNDEPSDVLARVIRDTRQAMGWTVDRPGGRGAERPSPHTGVAPIPHPRPSVRSGGTGPVLVCLSGSLGDVLMEVPGLKALAELTGQRVEVYKTRVRYTDTLDLVASQAWCGTVHEGNAPPDPAGYRAVVGASLSPPPDVLTQAPNFVQVQAERGTHQTEWLMATVRDLGYAGPTPSPRLVVPHGACLSEGLPDAYVVLAPGIRGFGYKRWPDRYWPKLARLLADAGVHVVVTGRHEDSRAWMADVGLDLCGRTSLAELALVLGAADAVVCTCTGTAHLAAAVRAPTLVLHGPTSPDVHGAWNPAARYCRSDRACVPCWITGPHKWRCPLVDDGAESPCMVDLTPERVHREVLHLLDRPIGDHRYAAFQRRWAWVQRYCGYHQDRDELWDLHQAVAEHKPRHVLEIGTRRGSWAASIAPACAPGATILAVDVDPSHGADRQRVADTVARVDGCAYEWIVADSGLDSTAADVRRRMPEVDLLHIDGDHVYPRCRRDFDLYSPLVRPGGMIVLHDTRHRRDDGPRRVWDELWAAADGRYERFRDVYTNQAPSRSMGTGIVWLKGA